MEQVSENPSFSPHIKKVLKNYRAASMNSLSGPDTFFAVRAAAKGGFEMELKKSLGSGGKSGGKLDDDDSATYSAPSSGHAKKKKMFAAAAMESADVRSLTPSSANTANNESVCSSKGKVSVTAIAAEGETASKGGSDYDPFLTPPPFPIQQIPILTASDQSRSERSETLLEDEVIQGFMVGGEKRLCLPQILNSVLRDFSLQQINQVCDELQIFCSRCNHDQLQVLKFNNILPVSAPSCGLITKTDAERLCNALLHSHPPRAVHDVPPDKRPFHFTIYHECFGKCRGVYTPEYYSSPLARCIECAECHGLFCPQKFVGHAHKALENRTCHWGFDSSNWRHYILAAKSQGESGAAVFEQIQSHLADMKSRFDSSALVVVNKGAGGNGNVKRKQHIENVSEEKASSKKSKLEESTYFPYIYDPMISYLYGVPALSRVSAFRPWSPMVGKDGKLALPTPPSSFGRDSSSQPLPPYLSHEPPVLLNPERVVPVSEMERFERHYQPNVALAPPSAQLQAQQKLTTTMHAGANTFANGERPETTKPSRTNAEIAVRGNPEMELSTDTEEIFSDTTTCSSLESPSHSPQKLYSEVAGTSSGDVNPSSFAKELKSLRDLMSEEQIDKKSRVKLMDKVLNLVKNCEEQLENSLLSKTQLLQELEYVRISKKERLRDASEAKHVLRKEVEKLYEEKVRREREMEELRKEASSLRHHHDDRDDDCSGSSEVKRANQHLRRKIDAMGEELQKLQDELSHLRRQQRACGSGGPSQGHRSGERAGGSGLAVQKDVASSSVSLMEHTKIKKEKVFESTSFDD